MHYYQFNIGDYKSHTEHLDLLEDLAYRRMMDWCYLHEKPLPKDIEEIARLIRMRSHNECIASVLREFFKLKKDGYVNQRIIDEIKFVNEKSLKAKRSAEARWRKNGKINDANALQSQYDSNATHNPIPNTHNTIHSNDNGEASPPPKKRKSNKFIPPSLEEVKCYALEKERPDLADRFFEYYHEGKWKDKDGKQVLNWKQKFITWKNRNPANKNQPITGSDF